MLKPCLILFVMVCGTVSGLSAEDPDEGAPVGIGSSCFEEGSFFYLTASERTPWSVNQISAVPIGLNDPEEWSESFSFQQRLSQELSGQTSVSDFAQACSAIWQEFFSDQTDILVTLKRTINKTEDVLECVSGNWIFTSSNQSVDVDISDWLRVGEQEYDVSSPSSSEALRQNLESILVNLNQQPGSSDE